MCPQRAWPHRLRVRTGGRIIPFCVETTAVRLSGELSAHVFLLPPLQRRQSAGGSPTTEGPEIWLLSLSAVSYPSSPVCRVLPAACYLLCSVCYVLSVDPRLPYSVCHVLLATVPVCCSLSSVSCLLSLSADFSAVPFVTPCLLFLSAVSCLPCSICCPVFYPCLPFHLCCVLVLPCLLSCLRCLFCLLCALCHVVSAMFCLLSPVFVPCLQHPFCRVLCHVLSPPLSAVSCLPHLLCPAHHVSSIVCCLPGPDCCALCARTCPLYTACSCGHTLAYWRQPSWVSAP